MQASREAEKGVRPGHALAHHHEPGKYVVIRVFAPPAGYRTADRRRRGGDDEGCRLQRAIQGGRRGGRGRALRDQVTADTRQAADTLATLTSRLAETTRPTALARQGRAALRAEAGQAIWQLARARGRTAAAIGVPAGILVIVVAAVLWQRRQAG